MRRSQCPQIAQKDLEDFRNYCAREGVLCLSKSVKLDTLKPIQADLSRDKMRTIMDKPLDFTTTIITSKDGYLLDGHHRVYAIWNLDPTNSYLPSFVFQCDINTLLGLARGYAKTFYKDDNDA